MRIIQPAIKFLEKFGSNYSFFVRLYSYPYRKVVAKEVRLAHITAEDIVLNVGCGAIPFTAIYLNKLTGAKIYALDCDQTAAKRAQSCVRKMGLEEDIEILTGNGAEISDLNFTAAAVALQAEPKAEILENLLSIAKNKTPLVFRVPSQQFRNHYDALPAFYQPIDEVDQKMKTFDKSVLYLK